VRSVNCSPLPFDTDTTGLWILPGTHGLAAVISLRAALLLLRIVPVVVLFVLAARLTE
jgi:hypothetical protein